MLHEQAPQLSDKELYDYFLEETVRLTDSAIGFFHRVSDDQKSVVLTTWNSEALKSCTASYETHYLLQQAGDWSDCVRFKRPVIYNDFSHSPNRKGLPNGHAPVRRFMSVPVLEGDKVRAIFGVGNKSGEYDDTDAVQIQLVANTLHAIMKGRRDEIALRKAHDELELRVQERTQELRKAYDRLMEETKERERAEEQLRHSQKMEALGTLSGGIAHDFNNILAAILGFTEMVHDDLPKDSREKHHLERVLQAGLRGRELIKQMLTFSRKTEQDKKRLLMSSVITESIQLLRASLPSTINIQLDIRSESGLILADPVQIQQVVMNLCTNAAHAMRERGGTLGIELADYSVSPSCGSDGMKAGLYMKLGISDTGTGIAPEIRDKIFDPFFTTKKPGEGSGLGLSVVHGIVKQSDGYVMVESEPDKGSSFILYFPKVAAEPLPDRVSDEGIPTGRERILFVDDEEALVEMGTDLLAELGYAVEAKTSSTEALALLKEDPSRYDLVITDQTMPDMTGIELARRILPIRPDISIILCTGFSHLVDADSAKAARIRAFVMKPLTKGELARTVRKVLDGRS